MSVHEALCSWIPFKTKFREAQAVHWELAAVLQVSADVQWSTSVHIGHVSTLPFWR
jgi:hypothetical protein